jgi:hypothetical protein
VALRISRIARDEAGHGVNIRWNAILSGAFLTLGFATFFLLLGNAIGLNVRNAVAPGAGGVLQFWSWIYMAGTMIFSYFLGSLLGTRSADVTSYGSGALHGAISWGFATALAAFVLGFASLAFNSILGGVGSNAGNWLALCTVGIGLPMAMLGGSIGKQQLVYKKPETTVEEERRVG